MPKKIFDESCNWSGSSPNRPKPNSKSVQQYLEDLQTFDSYNYQIVESLRQIIFELYPEVIEIVKYGGLVYSNDVGFGGIFNYKDHVSLEFSNGYLLEDKDKLLEGSGKFRRHLKFYSVEDIKTKKAKYFLEQVGKL